MDSVVDKKGMQVEAEELEEVDDRSRMLFQLLFI